MSNHGFNEAVDSMFKGLDSYMSSKTVVGDAFTVGDATIIPLVDVSFGMGAMASVKKDAKNGATGGMGGKISPSAVLVIKDGSVRIVPVHSTDPVSRIIDLAPEIIARFKKDPEVDGAVEEIISEAKAED